MQSSPNQIVRDSRAAVFSLRNVDPHVCRCLGYEFEDVIDSVDDSVFYAPRKSEVRETRMDRLAFRLCKQLTRHRYKLMPRHLFEKIEVHGEHELFFMFCQNVSDIQHLSRTSNWRESCQKTACWIDEMWIVNLEEFPNQLSWLDKFDFVFVTFQDTVEYLRKKGINAFHVPAGIDCLRFCPFPDPPERTIDVLAMGRKANNPHTQLFDMSVRNEINYLYDTSSLPNVKNYVDHRTLMAKQIGRAKIFFVQRAKADAPDQTNGQVELGSRYFEGCAGGAILVGERLSVSAFEQQFGWQDSVVEMPYDSEDISPVIELLNSDPSHLTRLHSLNLRNSILTHDWAYRWEEMLGAMGMSVSDGISERKKQLRKLAYAICSEEDANHRSSVA